MKAEYHFFARNCGNLTATKPAIIRLGSSCTNRVQPELSPIQHVDVEEATTGTTENVAGTERVNSNSYVTLGDIIRLGLF